MTHTLRLFLGLEGGSFVVASLIHRGLLIAGYEHSLASVAESAIAMVLLVALGLTWVWPARTRVVGLAVQAAALVGTLVGVFTIAVGVGPRTAPDIAYHVGILAVLVCGLIAAARSGKAGSSIHRLSRRRTA